MKPVEPIITVELFPQERAELLKLLTHLSAEDWNRPTACTGWSVKDVALHVLGGDVGLLSRRPDFKFPEVAGVSSWEELVAFINHGNKIWVEATQRMSTELLCKFLAFTGQEVYQRLRSLDLFALGVPVDWAGPEPAPIWLDVAREYTERWLHQQHIRDAVNRPGLKEQRFFGPVLETFVRAVPHTYRTVEAATGTLLQLVISGEAGGTWYLLKEQEGWGLYQAVEGTPAVTVTLDQELAWRLFTRGIGPSEAEPQVTLAGNRALGAQVLDAVAIIA